MDFVGIRKGTVRAAAYGKLARLSARAPADAFRALSERHTAGAKTLSSVAISLHEFEVLVALCDAAGAVAAAPDAARLAAKLRLYMLELPRQRFSAAVFRASAAPPWSVVADKAARALVSLAARFPDVAAAATLVAFVDAVFAEPLGASHYSALAGFLAAAADSARLMRTDDALAVFRSVDARVGNARFLADLERWTQHAPADLAPDVSPILFVNLLGRLMAAITADAVDHHSGDTLHAYIVARIAAESRPSAPPAPRSSAPGSSIGSLASSAADLRLDSSATSFNLSPSSLDVVQAMADTALRKLELLDRGESYIVYSSMPRLQLGYSAKSSFLSVVVCATLADLVDLAVATKVFYNCLGIQNMMLDEHLGPAIVHLGTALVYKNPAVGASLTRAFTTLVASPALSNPQCQQLAKSLGLVCKVLSQDAVVAIIYALTNLLFVGDDSLQLHSRSRRNTLLKGRASRDALAAKHDESSHRLIRNNTVSNRDHSTANGDISTVKSDDSLSEKEHEYTTVCRNAITAITEVVGACEDESVSSLAVAILSQKTVKSNNVISPFLIEGLVSCGPFLPEKEFVLLVNLLHRLSLQAYSARNEDLLAVLTAARCDLSRSLQPENPLYNVYLAEILSAIVSHGDVEVLDHHRPHDEISAIGNQIALYLKPLADLLPDVHRGEKPLNVSNSRILNLFRNIWFNMVVHGYSINSANAKKYAVELEKIAYSTPPLASELSWNRTETSLELNTVLKRGSSNHNVKDHRHIVGDVLDIPRKFSYSKLMFLAAAIFVERFRVKSGDCHTILKYYSDPAVKTSGIDKYLGAIAFRINKEYIELIQRGGDKQFSARNIAQQLTSMLVLSCHGSEDLQAAALRCSDLLVKEVPSSLCHHKSLFALFDLLTVLYDSVVDAEVNQYNPTFVYVAPATKITLKLPDSYTWRSDTFNSFYNRAISWIRLLLFKCNMDTKSYIQAYISGNDRFQTNTKVRFGISFALEMAGTITGTDRELSHLPRGSKEISCNLLPPVISQLTWRTGFISDLMDRVSFNSQESADKALQELREQVTVFKTSLRDPATHPPLQEITDLLSEIAGYALVQDSHLAELMRYIVEIPFIVFEASSMKAATAIWGAVMKERPHLSILILSEIAKNWEMSIKMKQGVFSKSHDLVEPEFGQMNYSPSDFRYVSKVATSVNNTFQPHSEIVKLFTSSFEATMNQSDHLLKIFTRFIVIGLEHLCHGSLHPFSRYLRFELIRFAFDILNYHTKLGSRSCRRLTESIYDSSLYWFKAKSKYPFGSNLLKIKADFTLLKEVAELLKKSSCFGAPVLEQKKTLLMFFMDDEISKISVWLSSANPHDSKGTNIKTDVSGDHILQAYEIDPQLAVNLALRYKVKNLDNVLKNLITQNPVPSLPYPDAVQYFIGVNAGTSMPSHHLLFWEALSPVDAITLFLPPFGKNPFILQYTMRSLEHHDVNLTFFYVPQIVQSLRYDYKGYVQRFIVETARVSSLFAHQIVWNMLANSYKDEDSTEPDSLKPTLDETQELLLENFSSADLDFYKKEFGFFNEVTSISGKLKPYIKKSKAEKKIKIDEEMAKIEVQPGVYLPSNPDGVLVDINRKSGKPLQSHAKAPFMATFKIKKEVEDVDDYGNVVKVPIEKWQSAIFKVGDDCRQDVLALQLISVFRTIWLNAGLDLYVFPYRVTATAPGCGVIDVLPNSTSRDMLGREAVNGLYEYFITKFGPESSIEFQQARNNLIRSLAGYSVISYLLQFKDRHNGNIMYDDQGHVLHIDFGFCFDIVPGGVKFEAAPFKLTKEMVMVLGGSENTQAYKWFEELCIKGYLACRPYMETIVRCVNPMLESGLPCFKETTIKRLRKRFVPGKGEKEAALYFKGLISKSYESFYTTGYDEFQRLTNGIPY